MNPNALTSTVKVENLNDIQAAIEEAEKAADQLQAALKKINCLSVQVQVTSQTASD